jgi:hypothetical protein
MAKSFSVKAHNVSERHGPEYLNDRRRRFEVPVHLA